VRRDPPVFLKSCIAINFRVLLATFNKGTGRFEFSLFQAILGVYWPYLKKVQGMVFLGLKTRHNLTKVLFVACLSYGRETDGSSS
jgi:hypothetical protein